MSDISFAINLRNNLLMEAELKDSMASFSEGGKIRIILKDGKEQTFEVLQNDAGRVVMSGGNQTIYTFTKDAIKNGIMTIHEYIPQGTNPEGEALYLDVKEFLTSPKSGEVERIDLEDKGIGIRVDEMNKELKNGKVGDTIYISSEEKSDGVELTNTILLNITDVHEKGLLCVLDDIESVGNDGDGDSSRMNRLNVTFQQKNIMIDFEDLAQVKNGSIQLNLHINNKYIPFKNILNIEVHDDSPDPSDPDEREMAKKEFLAKYNDDDNDDFKEAIDKTPNFWDTLANASPKGVNQLNNLIDKSITNNSYLTRGNYITFKLTTTSIIVSNKHKLIRDKKAYTGTMEKGQIIKVGRRKDGHFEIKIMKEIDPSTYNVKIKFCNKDLECKTWSNKSVIKIIGNK